MNGLMMTLQKKIKPPMIQKSFILIRILGKCHLLYLPMNQFTKVVFLLTVFSSVVNLIVEMGLGKTIEMLSLVHSVRAPPGTKKGSTLVIAPMSIISQWKSEADNSSMPQTLRTIIYYGADKVLDLPSLCESPSAPDVIITSYGVVLSEWTSGKLAEGIFATEWFRVILDEAHTIKNRLSKTARACYDIKAGRRWVLTGFFSPLLY